MPIQYIRHLWNSRSNKKRVINITGISQNQCNLDLDRFLIKVVLFIFYVQNDLLDTFVRNQVIREIQRLKFVVNKQTSSLIFVYKYCKIWNCDFFAKWLVANKVNWFDVFINKIINKWKTHFIEMYMNIKDCNYAYLLF